MNKLIILLIMVFLFPASGITDETIRITDHIDAHGKRISYITTKDILKKCPSWKLNQALPFPAHKAVKLSEQWVNIKYPKFTSLKIIHITLSPLWDSGYQDIWYYTMAFSAVANVDGINATSYFSVIVLMDGTVIGPN